MSRTRTRQKRDGLRIFPLTGVETPAMLPDVFPVRDFPNSTTTTAALYVQDEIIFGDGGFRLVPAVRVDHYRLEPEVDAIFAGDNPDFVAVDLTETQVSPKLGAVWHFSGDWSLFGGYARGFRAPPYSDVNIGFTNAMFGYTAIANPDLRPRPATASRPDCASMATRSTPASRAIPTATTTSSSPWPSSVSTRRG